MLQKPSAKSKPRDNAKYLLSRLERWNNGDLKSILCETNETQKRMRKMLSKKQETKEKALLRLMMFGKVGQAAKYINNDDSVKGVNSVKRLLFAGKTPKEQGSRCRNLISTNSKSNPTCHI